jgi:hypothetical protein
VIARPWLGELLLAQEKRSEKGLTIELVALRLRLDKKRGRAVLCKHSGSRQVAAKPCEYKLFTGA